MFFFFFNYISFLSYCVWNLSFWICVHITSILVQIQIWDLNGACFAFFSFQQRGYFAVRWYAIQTKIMMIIFHVCFSWRERLHCIFIIWDLKKKNMSCCVDDCTVKKTERMCVLSLSLKIWLKYNISIHVSP